MRRWRIAPSDYPLSSTVVADVMGGIGTPHLAVSFLGAMQRVLPVTFCTIFAAGASARLETVSAASSYGQTAERTAARYIAERFDRCDPHMLWLNARPLPRQVQRWIGHHRADELVDDAYRAACYTDVGIKERVSVLMLMPTGQRAAVSFYRSLAQPHFSAADFALIGAHAVVLAGAAAAHGRSTESSARAAGPCIEPLRLVMLSQREREVIGQLQTGRTAREVAEALGVGVSTVRTYQYRAFRRLRIGTLKELLRHG